ncbi:DUF3772 domain-containing protein [Frigidibacter sp. MR17.24]|uniref:DUF3772 domain-containing protein n=1 Tax=Frigidibacter sp. MR17.24 TaxID=3127345 RepID=UPI003012C108
MPLLRRLLLVLLVGLGAPAPAVVAVLALAAPGPALAQAEGVETALDYDAWAAVAKRAEDAVANARASDAAFNALRSEVQAWRDRFAAARTAGESRIQTVRGQIDALGPQPAEGATEAPDIAARRSQLTDQLAQLEAPRTAATEAFTRADGIIREIDTLLRDRSTTELLKTQPAPFNPANWPAAFTDIRRGFAQIGTEIATGLDRARNLGGLTDRLPAVLGLIAVAVGLLWKGPALVHGWTMRLRTSQEHRAQRLAGMLLSIGEVIVPTIGLVLLATALNISGLLPPRTPGSGPGLGLASVPLLAIPLFIAAWLARATFPGSAEATVPLAPDRQTEARAHMGVLGVMSALEAFRALFLTTAGDAGQAVLIFAIQTGAALSLWRLGRLFRRWAGRHTTEIAETHSSFFRQIVGLVGLALVVVALAGPLLAGTGWARLGSALTWSTVATLALFALLALLQRLATDVWLLATRRDSAENALMPVLFTVALIVLALPALALIWGARVTDLSDLGDRVAAGISLGGVTLNPGVIFTLCLVFGFGILITRIAQGALRSTILPRTRLDKGGQNAVVSGLGYVGISLAALAAIAAAGISLSSLAFVAGALSLGIGFGLQNIVQNFVSGIILLIERPVGEGDWIEAGGQMGIVKSISVRSTRIETFDKTEVIVPNADLISGQVVNWTRGNLMGRVIVPVGVAYGSDTRQVEKVLAEIAQNHPLITVNPPPRVFFIGFGADSMDFEIRAMVSDVNFGFATKSDINHEIARRFAEEGISIPFAQREVRIVNAGDLAGHPAPAGAAAPASPAPARSTSPRPPTLAADEPPPEALGTHDAGGDAAPDQR